MERFTNRKIEWQAIFQFDNLEKPVQLHLQRVYGSLAAAIGAAAAGAYIHLFTGMMQAGLLVSLLGMGLCLAVMFTPHTRENETKRFFYLMGFALCSGVGLGPLLDMAIQLNPSIIVSALAGTALIFAGFSFAALTAADRKFLYLGGVLMSALSWLMILGFANIFLGSYLLFQVQIYVGLAVMCAFVLFDTQLIIYKRRAGDDDYIWHSIDLFIDMIQIFRYLLIILSQREEKKKRRD